MEAVQEHDDVFNDNSITQDWPQEQDNEEHIPKNPGDHEHQEQDQSDEDDKCSGQEDTEDHEHEHQDQLDKDDKHLGLVSSLK